LNVRAVFGCAHHVVVLCGKLGNFRHGAQVHCAAGAQIRLDERDPPPRIVPGQVSTRFHVAVFHVTPSLLAGVDYVVFGKHLDLAHENLAAFDNAAYESVTDIFEDFDAEGLAGAGIECHVFLLLCCYGDNLSAFHLPVKNYFANNYVAAIPRLW
jgi:hypothetical protein